MENNKLEDNAVEIVNHILMCYKADTLAGKEFDVTEAAKLIRNEYTKPIKSITDIPIDKILRYGEPYSLPQILEGLCEATDILLHEKNYDGHGWEHLEYAYRYGREVVALFNNEPNPIHPPLINNEGKYSDKDMEEIFWYGVYCESGNVQRNYGLTPLENFLKDRNKQ